MNPIAFGPLAEVQGSRLATQSDALSYHLKKGTETYSETS
jgi:hypothetical protein